MMEISKLPKHAKTSKHNGKVFQGTKIDHTHDAANINQDSPNLLDERYHKLRNK